MLFRCRSQPWYLRIAELALQSGKQIYYSAGDSAAEAWASAVDAAYSTWRPVVDSARAAYDQAEGQAWADLVSRLAAINAVLEERRLATQAEFASALSEAGSLWHQRESEAWDNYLQSYSQLLGPRWLGSRTTEPPALSFETGEEQENTYVLLPAISLDTCNGEAPRQEQVRPAADLILPGDTSFAQGCAEAASSSVCNNQGSHVDYYPLGMHLLVTAPPVLTVPGQPSGSFWVRISGALQIVGGTCESLAGWGMIAAPDPTILSKLGGGLLVAHGCDHICAGWHALLYGEYQKPITVTALESVYGTFLSEESARKAAQLTDFTISLYGVSKYNPQALPTAFGNSGPPLVLEPVGFRPVRPAPSDPDYYTAFARRSSSGETPLDRFIRSPLEKVARSFRLQVFGHADGLWYHERLGGHTIRKHVGKSPNELLARLEAEPNLRYASTFRSLDEAENYIARVLEAHADKIADWLRQTGQQARALKLKTRFPESVGQVVPRDSSQVQAGHKVTVVLFRDSKSAIGFRVQTAYVEP